MEFHVQADRMVDALSVCARPDRHAAGLGPGAGAQEREVLGALRLEGGSRNDEGPGGAEPRCLSGRTTAPDSMTREAASCTCPRLPVLKSESCMPRGSTSGETASSPMPTATTSS